MTQVATDYPQRGVVRATWAALTAIAAGNTEGIARWQSKSVQVSGNFGTGGSVTIQGSNDGTNWFSLHDTDAADTILTFTAAGLRAIRETPLFVRPNVTAGTGINLQVVIVGVADG